jgi:hypothetical protein
MERYQEGLRYFYSTGFYLPLAAILFLRPVALQNPIFYFFLITLSFNAFAIGKYGSDINYFMEAWVGAILLLGQGFAGATGYFKRLRLLAPLALVVFLFPQMKQAMSVRIPGQILAQNLAFQKEMQSYLKPGDLVHCTYPGIFSTVPVPIHEIMNDSTLFSLVTSVGRIPFRADIVRRYADKNAIALWLSEGEVQHPNYVLSKKMPYYQGFDQKIFLMYVRKNPEKSGKPHQI